MATINHKTYNEGTETFKDFSVYDGKDTLIFKVDGSSSNVGIGISAPTTTLHLDASGGATIRLQRTSVSSNRFDVGTDGTNMEFNVRDTGAFTFGGGNVGIGTSAPEAKLDIKGEAAAGSVGMFIENAAASTTSNSADIYFGTWGGSTVAGITNARISAVNTLGVDARTDLDFYTYDGAASGKRVSITSGGVLSLTQGQIKFPATQVPSADPNTLDDYEEGTFTPVLNFSGGTTGITYSQQEGRYTKIGNVVNFILVITLTNKGTSTGGANISGLPFTIPTGNVNYAPFNIGAIVNTTFNTIPSAVGIINTNYMVLEENVSGGAQSALTEADFANNTEMRISGTYFV